MSEAESKHKYAVGDVLTHAACLADPPSQTPPRLYVLSQIQVNLDDAKAEPRLPGYYCRVLEADGSVSDLGVPFFEPELVPLADWWRAYDAWVKRQRAEVEAEMRLHNTGPAPCGLPGWQDRTIVTKNASL